MAQARPDWLSAIDGLWPAVEAKLKAAIETAQPSATPDEVRARTLDSLRAIMMIRMYRVRGHLRATLDPLGLAVPAGDVSELDPASYGFAESDFDRPIFLDFVLGLETGTMREILAIVRRTYCGNVGLQYMHISDPAEKAWLQRRIEGKDKEISFTPEGKIAILKKLIEAESFERFLAKRYPGAKRFGIDGGEAMVPAMEQIIKRGGALGVDDIVIGMPHRGRLNVLAAIMAKPYRVIFHEFQGGSDLPEDIEGSGDVKYHLGASSDREFDGNTVHLSLTANPSHLEAVNPVVLGKARAKQAFALRGDPNARARPRPAAADAWRRGLRRPGGRGRVFQSDGHQGLPHRRRGAFHRQQPDRLHHLSALQPLEPLPLRRRTDGPGADLPR